MSLSIELIEKSHPSIQQTINALHEYLDGFHYAHFVYGPDESASFCIESCIPKLDQEGMRYNSNGFSIAIWLQHRDDGLIRYSSYGQGDDILKMSKSGDLWRLCKPDELLTQILADIRSYNDRGLLKRIDKRKKGSFNLSHEKKNDVSYEDASTIEYKLAISLMHIGYGRHQVNDEDNKYMDLPKRDIGYSIPSRKKKQGQQA